MSADADAAAIGESIALAARLLAARSAGAAPSWRLALMSGSAGYLAYLAEPGRLIARTADQLATAEGPAAVAGWMGDAQNGPRAEDGELLAGAFGVALAMIQPIVPAATRESPPTQTSPPDGPTEPPPPPPPVRWFPE